MKIAAVFCLIVLSVAAGEAKGPQIVLERVSGSVAYARTPDVKPVTVIGSFELLPDDYALTRAKSMAALQLPDSSVVSIGASTRVKVGTFLAAQGTSRMQVAIVDGALHFAVKHPQGARANYIFKTPTAEIAVRGTEGMIAVRKGETVVACVHGTNTDTLVTALDGSRYYLPPGRTLRVRSMGGNRVRVEMTQGVSAAGFGQFAGIVAQNRRLRGP